MGEKFSDNSCEISKRQSSEFRVNLAVLETRILGFRGLLFYKWRLLKRVMESPSE